MTSVQMYAYNAQTGEIVALYSSSQYSQYRGHEWSILSHGELVLFARPAHLYDWDWSRRMEDMHFERYPAWKDRQ